jgi:hypothetical protein
MCLIYYLIFNNSVLINYFGYKISTRSFLLKYDLNDLNYLKILNDLIYFYKNITI